MKNIFLDKFELTHEENVQEYRPDQDKNKPKELTPTHTRTKVTIDIIAKEWKYLDTFHRQGGKNIMVEFDDKRYNVFVTEVTPHMEYFDNPSITIRGIIKHERKPSFEI
jgi:hypothetical protein